MHSPALHRVVLASAILLNNMPHPKSLLAEGCSTPSFAAPLLFPLGATSVAVGDFNADRRLDLVAADVGRPGYVTVLFGEGDGTFGAAATFGAGNNPIAVAVGDLNGDGQSDVAVANAGSRCSVLLGNGDGTFQRAVSYFARADSHAIAIGDFNADDRADLAVPDYGSNQVAILLGNGDGTFQAAVNYEAGIYPHSVAAGDFNADEALDLAVVNYATGVSVLLGNGNGIFQAALEFSTDSDPGYGPTAVASVDLDGNDTLDLVVANDRFPNAGEVSVLLGIGDGTFRLAGHYGAGINPYSVAAGDVNGDGKPDVAVANVASANISVLLGKGDGSFQTKVDYLTGPEPSHPISLALGDFNGDAKPDLSIANRNNSGTVAVLLNTCVSTNSVPVANAGATPMRVIAPNNRNARVVLDGSRSYDADEDPLQFSWFVDAATTPAVTGRVAVVVLSVGTHDVLLRVDDGQAAGTDHIIVRVLTAAEAVEELIAHVLAVELRQPQSLLSQLEAAMNAFDDGAFQFGERHLELFQQKVLKLLDRNQIDRPTAAALLGEAQAIINAVNGR